MDVLSQALSHIKYYDQSLEENFYMYDHLPYVNDPSICGKDNVALISGNVIKKYRYKSNELYPLDNKDDFMQQKLNKLKKEKKIAEAVIQDTEEAPEAEDLPVSLLLQEQSDVNDSE